MKTIILHGQNFDKSYERLMRFVEEAKTRNWEVLYDEVVPTPSLFGNQRLIIVRNLSILTKGVFKNLGKMEGTLAVYSNDELPQTLLKKFKDAKVEKYDVPKLIWEFLDFPSLASFHEVIKTEPPEFVFALLAKRIRDILIPPSHYKKWQIDRLVRQKSKFTDEKLRKMIDAMAQIDIDVKTGRAELVSSLDVFIVKNLQ